MKLIQIDIQKTMKKAISPCLRSQWNNNNNDNNIDFINMLNDNNSKRWVKKKYVNEKNEHLFVFLIVFFFLCFNFWFSSLSQVRQGNQSLLLN